MLPRGSGGYQLHGVKWHTRVSAKRTQSRRCHLPHAVHRLYAVFGVFRVAHQAAHIGDSSWTWMLTHPLVYNNNSPLTALPQRTVGCATDSVLQQRGGPSSCDIVFSRFAVAVSRGGGSTAIECRSSSARFHKWCLLDGPVRDLRFPQCCNPARFHKRFILGGSVRALRLFLPQGGSRASSHLWTVYESAFHVLYFSPMLDVAASLWPAAAAAAFSAGVDVAASFLPTLRRHSVSAVAAQTTGSSSFCSPAADVSVVR